ncbi:hypothetical protein [Desertivirga xinjiangensis]|uniref:hypothetical protein n=1 Tax=Desertivirga xinjiangensis TaxID=539206 RepID=UPI00210CE9F4|nr:hypothetical protein [Pedobacter xinjiangensis]
MRFKTLLLSAALLTVLNSAYGQTKSTKELKENAFFSQLIELKEFKIEDKRADSLKKAGSDLAIAIDIIEESPFSEDSLKNYAVGFIKYDLGPLDLILYEVKFDKGTKKIATIEKIYNEADLKGYGLSGAHDLFLQDSKKD